MRDFLIAAGVVVGVWLLAVVVLILWGRRTLARELVTLLPNLVRLFRGLLGDPRVPVGSKALLLLGALEGKVVVGSMNRGGLAGTAFEIDDRFTAYDAPSIAAAGFEGGKMLVRIDPEDHGTVATLESCARAVTDLARHALMAMVEPFISHRDGGTPHGRVRNDLTPEAVIRSVTVASGLGGTSAYTWLKIPVVDDMERVAAASTLPMLLLGGEVQAEPQLEHDKAGDKPTEADEEVIVWPVVDKAKVYVGEQIVYELQIWDRGNANLAIATSPTFKDFWSENLDSAQKRPTVRKDYVGNVPYQVNITLRRALFPQKAGTLIIGSPEIRSQPFNSVFFGSSGPPRNYLGRNLAIEVQPLPAGQRRFLGLARDCASCHHDPHEGRMQLSCETCHQQDTFAFCTPKDHDVYLPLQGAHAGLDCRKCHGRELDGGRHALEVLGSPQHGPARRCGRPSRSQRWWCSRWARSSPSLRPTASTLLPPFSAPGSSG